MERYVESTSQLVAEIYVRDIARSRAFYEALGFVPKRTRATSSA